MDPVVERAERTLALSEHSALTLSELLAAVESSGADLGLAGRQRIGSGHLHAPRRAETAQQQGHRPREPLESGASRGILEFLR